MSRQWIEVACDHCRGHGVVADYSAFDFEGAKDCDQCESSGVIWLHRTDTLAAWPGGPLLGRWPGEFARAVTRLRDRIVLAHANMNHWSVR